MNRLTDPLDVIDISCLGGLRFVDRASGQAIVSGLEVSVARQGLTRPLTPSPSGYFALHAFPGFEAAQRWNGKGAPPLAAEAFEVTVIDRRGDFLPIRFPSRLPLRGETGLRCTAAGATVLPVALYSAPARRGPEGFQRLRGWLVARDTGQPAAWARVRVSSAQAVAADRVVLGEGLSDAAGSFFVPFRMPAADPPPPPAPGAPPPASYRILVEAGRPAIKADAIPDLCSVLEQPLVDLLAKLPAQILAAQDIRPGRELILRTLKTDGGSDKECSELFFTTH